MNMMANLCRVSPLDSVCPSASFSDCRAFARSTALCSSPYSRMRSVVVVVVVAFACAAASASQKGCVQLCSENGGRYHAVLPVSVAFRQGSAVVVVVVVVLNEQLFAKK